MYTIPHFIVTFTNCFGIFINNKFHCSRGNIRCKNLHGDLRRKTWYTKIIRSNNQGDYGINEIYCTAIQSYN